MITGTHQGTPSGATSVKEKIATSASSTVMIGTSAAISAGTRGEVCGAARRSEAIRAAIPNDPFDHARDVADGGSAKQHPTANRPAGGADADVPRLAASKQRDDLQRHRERQQRDRSSVERGDELPTPAGDHECQYAADNEGAEHAQPHSPPK